MHREVMIFMRRGIMILLCCGLLQYARAQNPSGMIIPRSSLVRDTSGQRDIGEILLAATHIHFKKLTMKKSRTVYFSLLPLGTSVPGGGNALITSTTAGFYLGDRSNTYLSTITFSPSTNFRGQYNLPFHSNIWSSGNTRNYSGDIRFSVYPQYVWGLGGQQAESHKILISYQFVRFYQNALKRIRPWLFAGLGYNLDYRVNIRTSNDSIDLQQFTGYRYGTENHVHSLS